MTINEDYDIRVAFGKRVRELRKERGITQGQLASFLGYSQPTTISNLEKGLRLAHEDELPILAQALSCSPSDLVFSVGESRAYPLERRPKS